MPRANIPCISIEGAMISKRNFSGEERKFNPAGRRNFLVAFHDMDMVDRLIEDGWRIKKYEPREEGDEPYAVMQVAVSFDYYPPNICLIKGKRKIKITEETVSQLDYVEIANADLVIRPYQWTTELSLIHI